MDSTQTLEDLISNVALDTKAKSDDEAMIAAEQAKLQADATTLTADQQSLATALAASGPVAVVSDDATTVTVYQPSQDAPGYTTTVFPLARSVPVPGPTPAPQPAS